MDNGNWCTLIPPRDDSPDLAVGTCTSYYLCVVANCERSTTTVCTAKFLLSFTVLKKWRTFVLYMTLQTVIVRKYYHADVIQTIKSICHYWSSTEGEWNKVSRWKREAFRMPALDCVEENLCVSMTQIATEVDIAKVTVCRRLHGQLLCPVPLQTTQCVKPSNSPARLCVGSLFSNVLSFHFFCQWSLHMTQILTEATSDIPISTGNR
jgi:hypothetical protein